MAYNKWHKSLHNLDEMCVKHVVNIGAAKLHVKNHTEKWDGFRGKSLRRFI